MVSKKFVAVAILVVILFALFLLIRSPKPPPPPPGPATITGQVIDSETELPIPDATVTADGHETTTGIDGIYSLSVEVGKYNITVNIEGYQTKLALVDASEEKTYTVNIAMARIPPPPPRLATITGQVTDSETGVPISGATVTANGNRTTTGTDGIYFLIVTVGNYTILVNVEGYETKLALVDASEEKTYTVNIAMARIPLPPSEMFLFEDTYEDNPTFKEATTEEFEKMEKQWEQHPSDDIHWLEFGRAKGGLYGYILDYSVGSTTITDSVSRSGSKSLENIAFAVPEGHQQICVGPSRYFGNESLVDFELEYEVGAYFYVPEGYLTPCYVSLERFYQFKHTVGGFAIVPTPKGVGLIIAWTINGYEHIGNVTFEPNTWFKLWLTTDIREDLILLVGYESATQKKTFEVMKQRADISSLAYTPRKMFFIYASILNYSHDETMKAYIDDFYAKVAEKA